MKPKIKLLCLTAVAALLIVGCGTIQKTPTVDYSTTPPTTNNIYSVNPAVSNIVAGIHAATPLIPPPYGTVVDAVAGLALAGLGLYARKKTIAANEHADNASLATSMLNTVITGVELAGDTKTKQSIANISAATGNYSELSKQVSAVTSAIPPVPIKTP